MYDLVILLISSVVVKMSFAFEKSTCDGMPIKSDNHVDPFKNYSSWIVSHFELGYHNFKLLQSLDFSIPQENSLW